MLLIRVKDADASFEKLKKQGVLIKNVSKMHPLLSQCLRLTVGTPEENQRLLLALQEALKATS
jgi:histidinol-phosphate aminotransferase